jgi:hypothetical protein
MDRAIRSDIGERIRKTASDQNSKTYIASLPSLGRASAQDPRRRVMPEMELAIVRDTKATIAKPKMTTTMRNSLPGHGKEGQVGFQTQALYYQ